MKQLLEQASTLSQAISFLLSTSKAQSITFSLRDTANEVNLVITLDCSLSWKLQHIESLCCKLSRVVLLLRSLIDIVPNKSKGYDVLL